MFEHPTQPSSIVLEIANVRAIIHYMKQDDDDCDWEIGEDSSEDPPQSTLSCEIKADDFDNEQEVLYLHQAYREKTIRPTRISQPKQRSCADTIIARTSLPNLWHPARAIAPPLLKLQKSTINILRKSDVIPSQAMPLPKAGGDQNVPQTKAGGNHSVPQHQMRHLS